MFDKCEGCDATHPVCGGQADPRLCTSEPRVIALRRRRSAYFSSLHGWPGTVELPECEERPQESATALIEPTPSFRPRHGCGWPLCVHRAFKTHCGEVQANCALGHGQAGIVEREDCSDCTDISA